MELRGIPLSLAKDVQTTLNYGFKFLYSINNWLYTPMFIPNVILDPSTTPFNQVKSFKNENYRTQFDVPN